MDFAFTEEQAAFRDEFRDWLAENLPGGWAEGDWDRLPEDEDDRVSFLRDWQRTMHRDGWVGPSWPEEYGGMGLSPVEEMIYEDELARVGAPPQINGIGVGFAGPTLIEMGTEEQKERYIPHILNADEIWCQGYSEPDHGSDIAGLETAAEKDGDEWVLNGQKIWTSGAHYAEWYILIARTDFSGTKHEGLTAFIVDMDQEGIRPEPIHQITDDADFNQVFIDDARAPHENVVGEVGGGWDVIRTISAYEQTASKAFHLQRRFNDLVTLCQHAERAGRPLAEDPTVRRKLAEFDARIEAARLTTYRTVSERIDDPVPGPEATADKLTTDELAVDLENFAMKLLGPRATLWAAGPEGGLGRTGPVIPNNYLWSYGDWIAGGTGDVYHNIIGEQALRLPKDIKSDTTHRRDGG